MAQRPAYPDNFVFDDGMTFKNIRDAITAASATGMWHVSKDMAQRYKVEKMLCLKCAKVEMSEQNVTYFAYRSVSIRICRKCAGSSISLR